MDLKELDRDQSHGGSADRHSEEGRSLVGAASMDQTRPSAEQMRRATAERIGTLAGAAYHAAGDLEAAFPQTARYLHDTAAGFDHISNLLRNPSLDDLATLIGNVRRKEPAAMVAGLVLIGLGLSWFLNRSQSNAARAT